MEDEASSRSSSRSTSRSASEHSNDDLPVPQVMGEILEAFENIPQERTSEHMHEKIVDVPVLHVALKERISERMHEQIVDVPVPQKMKDRVELVSRFSQKKGRTR